MSIPAHSHPEVLSGKGLSSQSPVSGLTQKTSFPCICSQLVWKLHYQSLIWLTLSPTPGWHCDSRRERRHRAGERRRAGSYSSSGTNNQRQRGPNPLLQLKATPLLQEGAGSCTEASTKHKETFSGPYLLIWKMSSLEGSPNPFRDCLPDSLDFKGPMAKLGEGRTSLGLRPEPSARSSLTAHEAMVTASPV